MQANVMVKDRPQLNSGPQRTGGSCHGVTRLSLQLGGHKLTQPEYPDYTTIAEAGKNGRL